MMKDLHAGTYFIEKFLGWLLHDVLVEFACENRLSSLQWFLLGLFGEETFLESSIFLNSLILLVVLRE